MILVFLLAYPKIRVGFWPEIVSLKGLVVGGIQTTIKL